MIIPYYNMFLCSPQTTEQDVDRWVACFDEIVTDMVATD
jgi:hypothetical protein